MRGITDTTWPRKLIKWLLICKCGVGVKFIVAVWQWRAGRPRGERRARTTMRVPLLAALLPPITVYRHFYIAHHLFSKHCLCPLCRYVTSTYCWTKRTYCFAFICFVPYNIYSTTTTLSLRLLYFYIFFCNYSRTNAPTRINMISFSKLQLSVKCRT